jgi:hypothetical protein
VGLGEAMRRGEGKHIRDLNLVTSRLGLPMFFAGRLWWGKTTLAALCQPHFRLPNHQCSLAMALALHMGTWVRGSARPANAGWLGQELTLAKYQPMP